MENFSFQKFLDNKYIFKNEPVVLDTRDYETALSSFVKKFSAYPNVISIYKFGTVSAVGISDIDFLVVLEERPLMQSRKDLAYRGFSRKDIYIYNNTPPIYVSEEILRNFSVIFPVGKLELLYGRNVDQKPIPNKSAYDILIVIELMTKFYPKVFLELLYSPEVNTRRALLLLNAMRYMIDLAGSLYEVPRSFLEYNDGVSELRSEWFSMGNEKYASLISFLYKAVIISLKLMEKTREFLLKKAVVASDYEDNREIVGSLQKGRFLFVRDFTKERALEIILERYRSRRWLKRFSLVLPDIFMIPLNIYMEGNGILSSHLKRNLKTVRTFRGSLIYSSEAERRIAVLNSLMYFIEKYGVFPNGVHLYYGYWPHVGVRNRVIQKFADSGLL